MAESNGIGTGTDGPEADASAEQAGHGRHRGAVTSAPATQGMRPEPHGRHRGPRAEETQA
ncbi:hypothetical protein [Streptomyces sp. NPDC016845]|uniref:hypothetical protein n=1 Tax=Streptomyces sp. NPDC016845 TaxID=3364972 RepID=UPI003796EF41